VGGMMVSDRHLIKWKAKGIELRASSHIRRTWVKRMNVTSCNRQERPVVPSPRDKRLVERWLRGLTTCAPSSMKLSVLGNSR
jgi:hypothetical protein